MTSSAEEDNCEKEFRQRISRFFSSFSLNDAVTSKREASVTYKKLHTEMQEGYGTTEELYQTKNLVSYLLWQLGEKDDALELCNSVLNYQKTNIIALANKSWFKFYSEDFVEANIILEELDRLSDTPEHRTLMNEAEAELAYSYSRFGPRFNEKSIELFEKVISENQQNYLWKFGLALTYRRQTHLINHPLSSKTGAEMYLCKALELFREITILEIDTNLRAKAFCELGSLISLKKARNPEFHFRSEDNKSLSSEECFEEALKLSPNDTFVLERSGKQFRYLKKLDLSRKLLEKAIAIRETPFGLHHLALTLLKQVEVKNKRPRRSELPDSKDVLYAREKSNECTLPKRHNTGRGKGRSGQGHGQNHGQGKNRHESIETQVNMLCIKSPTETIIDPDSPILLQAKDYLERAIDLYEGKYFATALRDLGLVYRQLNLLDKAIDAFNKIVLAKESSRLERVIAFEQIGICYHLISRGKECSTREYSRYYNDAKVALFKAVRLMASLCSALPDLKLSLNCYPTLLSMLTETIELDDSKKELAELHRLLVNHKNHISFYEEVRDILKEKTPEKVLELVDTYLEREDYDNALLLLNMMWCSKDTRNLVSTEFYVSSHMNAWLHSVNSYSFDCAIQYLQDAYHVAKQNIPDPDTSTRDVVVLCNCDGICDIYTLIKVNLEKMCGLSCKFNTDDCLPGRPEMDNLLGILQPCDGIILLLHNQDATRTNENRIQTVLEDESFRRKTILVADEAEQALMNTLPKVKLPKEGADMIKWIQDLLSIILKL